MLRQKISLLPRSVRFTLRQDETVGVIKANDNGKLSNLFPQNHSPKGSGSGASGGIKEERII